MFTGLRFAVAAFALMANPAFAASQIIFIPDTKVQPAYSTAAVVQAFSTQQVRETGFVPNISNAAGTTEATNGTARSARILDRSLVGNSLVLRDTTFYTLSFDNSGPFAGGVRYLSFLIGNYKSAKDSVFLHYTDGTQSGNILSALLGLNESPAGNHGIVVINRGYDAAIDSITFRSFDAGIANEFRIDEIAAATPEPAAWLMMILGFGLVGAHLRSRRRAGLLAIT
ncbi:MAG: PEPxxWA-CTERM sorting domain-containing protein [Novosphingobium sp.]